jgi:hypothetical protein
MRSDGNEIVGRKAALGSFQPVKGNPVVRAAGSAAGTGMDVLGVHVLRRIAAMDAGSY